MTLLQRHPLLIVAVVAVIAPLLRELPIRLRLPVVVLEILLGVAVGPYVLGWLEPNDILKHLSEYGLGLLIFLAGLEIDFAKLRGPPLQRAGLGWVLSVVIAFAAALSLQQVGFLKDGVLVAVALSTTAMGMLLPILNESGESESGLGRYTIGAAAVGEFGPIVLFSLIAAGSGSVGTRSGLLLTFALIAISVVGIAARVRAPKAAEVLMRRMHAPSQLPIRAAVLLIAVLWVVAQELGLDVLLGAFTAGIVVGLLTREQDAESFEEKLHAVGFGFLIPIFFVMSGVALDLPALFASTTSLVRVPVFLLLMLVARGLPALLYRQLPGRERLALALFSATGLPLVVAIGELGRTSGRLLPENAAALVGAAILSVLIFPLLAMSIRAKTRA